MGTALPGAAARLAGDEQDPALIDRWGGQTLEHLLALVNSEQAPASGCMSLMGERRLPPTLRPVVRRSAAQWHAPRAGSYHDRPALCLISCVHRGVRHRLAAGCSMCLTLNLKQSALESPKALLFHLASPSILTSSSSVTGPTTAAVKCVPTIDSCMTKVCLSAVQHTTSRGSRSRSRRGCPSRSTHTRCRLRSSGSTRSTTRTGWPSTRSSARATGTCRGCSGAWKRCAHRAELGLGLASAKGLGQSLVVC